jgi:hypothetical protein
MLTGAGSMTDDRLLCQGPKIHACGATWARSGCPEWHKLETLRKDKAEVGSQPKASNVPGLQLDFHS